MPCIPVFWGNDDSQLSVATTITSHSEVCSNSEPFVSHISFNSILAMMGLFSEPLSSLKLYNDARYHSIDNTDDDKEVPRNEPNNKRFHLYAFAAGLSAAAVFAILVFGVTHLLQPRSRTFQEIEDDEWNHCGRSSKIAMAKGCVMEPLFYGWMPSKCVFPELTDQFPVFEDRHWYSDANMTQLIAPKDLYVGKHKLIWTQR